MRGDAGQLLGLENFSKPTDILLTGSAFDELAAPHVDRGKMDAGQSAFAASSWAESGNPFENGQWVKSLRADWSEALRCRGGARHDFISVGLAIK
jgi:hypothetical protein